MRHWLEDTLNQLADASSPWESIQKSLAALGLERTIYTFLHTGDGRTVTRTTMPAWWEERFVGAGRGEHDPFFQYCCMSYAPMRTGPAYLGDYPFLGEPARQWITDAGDAGFCSGLSLPVGIAGSPWVGGFNVGGELRRRELDRLFGAHGAEVRLALMVVHERLAQGDRAPFAAGGPALTPRECECLTGLAVGEQSKQIAYRLGISDRTVEFHVANARRKLGATTREQAVARAVYLGIVVP
ncbi:MAG: LuxR C-terminal-related transcriptional regulator [Myxococcota bacterium]